MIRHEIAWRQLQFFKKNGVRRAWFLGFPVRAIAQRDGFLFATVHPILELHRLDAVVIGRLDRDREFISRCCLGIAAWIGNRHAGFAIGQRFDGVLHRTRNRSTLGRHEIDAIERILPHLERRRYFSVCANYERHRAVVVETQYATFHRHRDIGLYRDRRANNGRNITTVFDVFNRHSRVARKLQIHRHFADGGQVGDRQLVRRRHDAVGLDVILGWTREIEHARRKAFGRRITRHWQPHPLG